MQKLENLLEWGGTKRDIAFLVIGGIALFLSIFDILPLPFDPAWIAIILCGVPIILEAVIGLVTAFDIKADVLVSHRADRVRGHRGRFLPPVRWLLSCSWARLLEDLTVARARAGIEKLVHLTPQTARVIDGDAEERVIPAEEVQVGDLLRVLPGRDRFRWTG